MPLTSPLRDDATSLYGPYEAVIDDWTELQDAVNRIGDTYPDEQFVWRGQAEATWGLTSSLYRTVAEQRGRVPSEKDLVDAEKRLLKLARDRWRLDGIPALQLFARMQHVGVPTRLLDATFNPLIATWFAVDATMGSRDADARLFAFTVREEKVQLDSRWNDNTPLWHWHSSPPTEWGTGLGRRVWQPPALHARIPAQNAAFLLDGVPVDGPPHALPRIHPDESSTWNADDLRTVASIPIRLGRINPDRGGRINPAVDPRSTGLVFTYRITANAKRTIRHQLENRFGFNFATIYADIEGLAEYLRHRPQELVDG